MAGLEIRVPDDWEVQVRGVAILGAYEDKTRTEKERRALSDPVRENAPKSDTTECTAPIRAHASIAIVASGIMGI